MDIATFGTFVERFGLPLTMTILAVVVLIRGMVVPRWYFDRESERADYWQATAERLLQINQQTQEVARQSTQVAREAVRKATTRG